MNFLTCFLSCAGLSLLITSCASNGTSSGSSASAIPNSGERVIAERVYSLVNAKRGRSGKPALAAHQGLNSIAQKASYRLARSRADSSRGMIGVAEESRSAYADLKYGIESMNELTFKAPAGAADPASRAIAKWSRESFAGRSFIDLGWDVVGVGVSKSASATYITLCLGTRISDVPRSVRPIGW